MEASECIGVSDMTTFSQIDEHSINNNLKLRYENDIIYEYISKYHERKVGIMEPHVFALTEAAYKSIIDDEMNQSCVISGESGAGKTESTKHILQYLCAVTSHNSSWVQQQILEANTILEAFGNAKTIRNDNSSRFGKFMQVCFDSKHSIKGCVIQDYLLEQSRITFQSLGERNYHVLYQLVAQGQKNSDACRIFKLKSADSYRYLNASGNVTIDIDCEVNKFEELTMAFTVLQIPQILIDGILKVLSAILWLGNLEFSDVDGELCEMKENDVEICSTIAELLGLKADDLLNVTLRRQINVRGNITEIPLKFQEARENRHAMAKALYSRTFAWLIKKINSCTNPGKNGSRFLGVLDIFGFENFPKNSFEQLCINYANEKLHKFFNHYVFAVEQEIYQNEGITYAHVDFTDNSMCLELIEKPPRCILKLLTEQCHMPKGSDSAYLNNLHTEFEYNPCYVKGVDRRHWEHEFAIKHYAGCVTYAVEGIVDKNRDVQQDVLFDLMSRSDISFVREISTTQDLENLHSHCTTTLRGTSKAKFTVSDTFRQQLQVLIDVLQNTKSWYVRCIKPNAEKLPNTYDEYLVLDQIKYLGMLDIIRIRREGYPIHLNIHDFIRKYRCLLKYRGSQTSHVYIDKIMEKQKISRIEWQVGKTKVFLRKKAYEPLEDVRKEIINTSTVIIQKTWRCYIQVKTYKSIKDAAQKIQHSYRGWKLRIQFLKMRRSAITIQSHLRGVFAREVATALREMRRVDDEMKKRERVCSNEDTTKALEDCERSVNNDMLSLSNIAEQITCRLEKNEASKDLPVIVNGNTSQQIIESVDLDNLFAFLSETNPQSTVNPLFEEICDNMDNLVQDLSAEIQSFTDSDNTELVISKEQRKNIPSLPEPTMSPPPPPNMNVDKSDGNIYLDNCGFTNNHSKTEPIYEAVIPDCVSLQNSNIRGGMQQNLRNETKINNSISRNRVPNIGKSESILYTEESGKFQDQQDRDQRRKNRVEKKLLEMHQNTSELQKDIFNNDLYYDILEFADNYFNFHNRSPEGTIIATLTRKTKKINDVIPKYEMITFLKSDKIPLSHIHLYDPENVLHACNIFRELCKYMRGELNSERELQAIQYIIGLGIDREELRDEIFVQCIRQTTNNPHTEWMDRLWLLLCLTIVAFQPSKSLFRYFVSYLKKNLELFDGKLKQYAQWCFDNCKCTKVSARLYPPSSVEVAAMRRLGTIVCRFFFLDGRTKAIDVHPTDTAGDAVLKLAEKLNLCSTEGWAIFQSRPDGEKHIKSHDYLYDIISAWEIKQMKTQSSGNTSKRLTSGPGSGENRFVFKKRLFKSTRKLSQDPVEVNMLYAQAVYCVVKCDDFPVSEKVALQLAGLQAQVALGDPSNQPKPEYYCDINNFLPQRISKTREKQFWIPIMAQAHRQYGASRNELTAKVLYLSCVMQYPLYGTTMFNVTYKGYWMFANNIILGINFEGLMFIKIEDKCVLYKFKYNDIESIMLDPSDNFLTITLNRHAQQYALQSKQQTKEPYPYLENQRCFVFETSQKNEIGSLIISYYPPLSNWIMNNSENSKNMQTVTSEDRSRLYSQVVLCRRQLIDSDVMRKPQETGGFFKTTLRKLSKHRLEKFRAEQRKCFPEPGESYKTFPHAFWAFSKQHIQQCLSKLSDQDESIMSQIFNSILTYAGLGTMGETVQRAEDEHITIVQSIMDKCMRKDSLINELYLQLIKQTTDHPDPNSRVNLRHWALLSLTCSVILPPLKSIKRYLLAHLKHCATDLTEEGKYARFAEKCFFQTQGTRRRQWPPSRDEILCTINRRPCYARFYFMDGQFHSIEFKPNSTVYEVMEIIKRKIGLQEHAMGYAIYEVLGSFERSLLIEEKVSDVMGKWEKYRNTSQQGLQNQVNFPTANCRYQYHGFLFKKQLFCDNFIKLDDPVEKELLYHQILHGLRSERFPITEMEAIMLTALQGQLEFGDCGESLNDYRVIASHCLPPRFVPNIPHEAVVMHHQSLRGMLPAEAKKSFLNLIQSWPLYRATIFDVMAFQIATLIKEYSNFLKNKEKASPNL